MSSPWIALREVDDAARCGHKAATLAALARAGIDVLPGWVLPADASTDDAADVLLDLHSTASWILRSSSRLEDRPGASAAGVFRSETASAVPEDVARAIDRVRASADDPAVRRAVGVDELDVAVLAQPHRAFDRWCTVELSGDEAVLEGWIFPADAPPRRWTERDDRVITAAREAAAAVGVEPALLEIGIDDAALWILQVRPAPRRRVRRRSEADAPTDPVGLGAHVAPGDEDVDWQWDHAHSPLPLCPLLATVFGRWIAASDGAYPSRLIDGRWFDPPKPNTEPFDAASAREELREWDDAMDATRARLAPIDEAARAIDVDIDTWRRFVDAWLEGQRTYFDTPSGRLRRRVRALEEERRIQVAPHPGRSVAARRARRWAALAASLHEAGWTTPHAVLVGWDERERAELATRLDTEHDACSHLCALPYDGRAVPWEEDREAFVRAVLRHHEASAPEPVEGDADLDLARDVVTRAEDDDDLLLRLYLAWRHAVRRLAEVSGRPVDDVLDVCVDDLEAWMEREDGSALDTAVDSGRALADHWTARRPTLDATDDAPVLHGRAASPGRVEGPVVRAVHVGDIDSIEPGTIAVVESVLPSDAALVPFLAGLVCESGDVLGHASILAREAGIPCVVDVPQARRALARTPRVTVDGDAGAVVRG